MQDRALNHPKIEIMWNSEIIDMQGDPSSAGLESVTIRDTVNNKSMKVNIDGVFMAIGHIPNSQLFEGTLELNSSGYICTEGDTSKTSIPGVFAAGDIHDTRYKQAITAAGSGCKAAIDAEKFLEK